MKFTTDAVTKCAARLGRLSDFSKFPDIIFETPLVLLYTKRGAVPHLTKDVLKMLTNEQQLLSVSLPSIVTMTDSISQSNLSFTEFVSMNEYPTLLTIQDPAEEMNPTNRKNDSIAVWTKHGYHYLDSKKYMDTVEILKPDMYMALCDGNTNKESTKKRISKSMENSKSQLKRCYERHQSSEILKNSFLLGPVEGGFDLIAREESVKLLSEMDLPGYVIDGIHQNGPAVQDFAFTDVKEIIQHTINLLPAEKLKVSMGCWNPLVVLELIESGIDIFDTSYPYVLTESSKALTLIYNNDKEDKQQNKAIISIADKSYVNDFTPICKSCECLTCKNHTKAYINHLHNTKEMLCYILLMIHNTHQYLEFFKAIRKHMKSGTLSNFKKQISTLFL